MEYKNLNRLLDEFSKLHQQNTFNPFAAWGMSENDHTKLLMAFLRYNDTSGGYPVLRSFLFRFTGMDLRDLNNVKVEFNHGCEGSGYIDGYVTFICHDLKYALIIENKVYDAPDQRRQIQRYIEHALKDIRKNPLDDALQRIWVLYITRDGSKIVSEDSYSMENKDSSTYIGNRFVGINYREHIIDWFNLIVDSQYAESLVNVAKAYREYLVYEFCNEEILSTREKLLLKIMGISEDIQLVKKDQVKSLYDLRRKIQHLRRKGNSETKDEVVNNVSSALSEVLSTLEKYAFGRFEKYTKSILDEWTKDKELKWIVAHRGLRDDGKGYLQIRLVDNWGTAHMELDPISVSDMLFGNQYNIALHLEGHKGLRNSWIEEINGNKSLLPMNGQISSSSRLFKWTINTNKPFGKMEEHELIEILTKLYTKESKLLFSMLIQRFDEYKD